MVRNKHQPDWHKWGFHVKEAVDEKSGEVLGMLSICYLHGLPGDFSEKTNWESREADEAVKALSCDRWLVPLWMIFVQDGWHDFGTTQFTPSTELQDYELAQWMQFLSVPLFHAAAPPEIESCNKESDSSFPPGKSHWRNCANHCKPVEYRMATTDCCHPLAPPTASSSRALAVCFFDAMEVLMTPSGNTGP